MEDPEVSPSIIEAGVKKAMVERIEVRNSGCFIGRGDESLA